MAKADRDMAKMAKRAHALKLRHAFDERAKLFERRIHHEAAAGIGSAALKPAE